MAPVCSDCSVTDQWVFWLCVAFGFGFFVLLVIIVFLLSAVTCDCVSSEVEKEKERKAEAVAKEPIVEEFDPYAKSWHGSQYGSRCEKELYVLQSTYTYVHVRTVHI